MEVDCGGIHIVIAHDEENIEKIAIPPQDVYISAVFPPGPSVNRYEGKITTIDFQSTVAKLVVKVGNISLKAELPSELAKEMGLIIGKKIYLILRLRKIKVLGNQENSHTHQFGSYRQEII